jgi:single-strand DNA-binding protein
MFSLNRVSLIGYQTQPVELRQTPSGTAVTDLNIVVPTSFTAGSGEQLTGKGFFTVTLWGPMAEVAAQYVRPGAQLYISGRLQTDSWDDQTSGEKRSKTKVVAQDMILLDPKDGQRPAPTGAELGRCLNHVEVVGNVTKDPEMRTTTSGQNVLTIGVASNERWKDRQSGEMKERTEFHNVVVWGALAQDVAKQVKKGGKVFVAGRVQTRSWETQSGAKRTTTEIVADQLSMLGVAHPVAQEAVSARAAMPARERSQEEVPVAVAEAASIPEVQYQSDVKVEDLPF